MPTVSIIVPVYNRAHIIGETLRALQRQERAADEIIVVDDGSTDGSANVARAFGPTVRVIETRNGGPALARNIGLAAAESEYVQFIDSDDLPSPGFIGARLEAITRANADMAYGQWLPAWINDDVVASDGFVRQTAEAAEPLNAFLHNWVLFIPNTMLRRTLIEDAGGYPEGLVTGEDMLLMFRMLRRTERIVHTKKSVLLVRQHPQGQISARSDLMIQRLVDEVNLTEIVSAELRRGPTTHVCPSSAAVRAWTWRKNRALAEALKSGIEPESSTAEKRFSNAFTTSIDLLDRLASRIRFMRHGHRLSSDFHVAPIDASHISEIRALGSVDFHPELSRVFDREVSHL